MRRSRLEKVAARLVSAAGADDSVIVGGLAVGLHGYVRATDDVDILVRGRLEDARARLEAKGIRTQLRREDSLEGDFPSLRGEIDGIRFDVLPELAPVAWERLPEFKVGRVRVRVVDLRGLVALKLKAQGPQDLLDVAALAILHPEIENAARELATTYGIADRFDAFLRSPRLRAQVRDADR
jgi:hypothetical protein